MIRDEVDLYSEGSGGQGRRSRSEACPELPFRKVTQMLKWRMYQKKLKRISIFLNVLTPKVIYGFISRECNSYQNLNDIFHKNRKKHPKICVKPEKIPKSQNNLGKE